jgi:hypothetical protein
MAGKVRLRVRGSPVVRTGFFTLICVEVQGRILWRQYFV